MFFQRFKQFFRQRSLFFRLSFYSIFLGSLVAFVPSYLAVLDIYNERIAEYISFRILFLCLFIPAIVGVVLVIVIIKVIYDRVRLRNLLRFRLVMTFVIITVVSFIFYLSLFRYFFGRSVEYIDDRTITLVEKLIDDGRVKTQYYLNDLHDKLLKDKLAVASGAKNQLFDNSFIYDFNGDNALGVKSTQPGVNILRIQQVIKHERSSILKEGMEYRNFFLDMRLYVVGVPLKDNQMLIAMEYDHEGVTDDINGLLYTLEKSTNFQTLKPLISLLLQLFFIYIYLAILGLGVVIYFFISFQIVVRINALSDFNRGFTERYMNVNMERYGGDEIRQLVEGYKKMMRSFSRYRQKERMIAQYGAWKSIALKIAHEIKNPLTPIQIAVNNIEDGLKKNDPSLYFDNHDNFEIITERIEFIRKLIRDFSDFSKTLEIEMSLGVVAEVKEVIEKVLFSFSGIHEIKFSFASNIDESNEKLQLMWSAEKMEQVFLNLIQNSIDSLNSVKRKKKEIHLELELEGKALWVSVEDNGAGIAEKDRKTLFKPYFTKKSFGTGLGLTICKDIVFHHGGKIVLEKSDEKKTVFRLRLPLFTIKKTKRS